LGFWGGAVVEWGTQYFSSKEIEMKLFAAVMVLAVTSILGIAQPSVAAQTTNQASAHARHHRKHSSAHSRAHHKRHANATRHRTTPAQ
jgi:hypothetical protein